MKVLIKNATIIDPLSPHHQTQQDIFIENGFIAEINNNLSQQADTVIDEEGLFLSPGWIDGFANFCDPGYEFKETLETGAAAAASGGFVTVMVIPNTRPVIDSKSQVEYIIQKAALLPVNIYPIGAITKNNEGKELAEMYDMQNSGAISFSDGLQAVQSAGILLKALQYVKTFQGVIIQVPDDKSIAPNGLMNEGIVSTRLGLAGKPVMAEELVVARDIKLARYTDSSIHFTGITSPKSIEYIQRAKSGGIKVTASVTPHHLFFCDEDLTGYDTNLKVNPPLRTRKDMLALRDAVKNGLIDSISTHHAPHEYDSKVVEFEYAKNGLIGLESCYAVLKTILPEISEEKWVELLSVNPAKIFGIKQHGIQADHPASITMFQPNANFTFTELNIRSKSRNSPFIGKELRGKVVGIINGQKIFLN
jgi:dihydroorotase